MFARGYLAFEAVLLLLALAFLRRFAKVIFVVQVELGTRPGSDRLAARRLLLPRIAEHGRQTIEAGT